MSEPKLWVAALVKDEMHRYWASALEQWSRFADELVVLDDNSTDGTFERTFSAPRATALARYGATGPAWGQEAPARAELWNAVMGYAAPGDFVLWLDADMAPAANPRELLHRGIDTYYFPLYDLWGQDERGRWLYRDDMLWQAHRRPRPWMIRVPRSFTPEWPTRGIHCGHLPENWRAGAAMFVPPSHALLHWSYADERDRAAKHASYLSLGSQLSEAELAHARSIVDPEPVVRPLFERVRYPLERAA